MLYDYNHNLPTNGARTEDQDLNLLETIGTYIQ